MSSSLYRLERTCSLSYWWDDRPCCFGDPVSRERNCSNCTVEQTVFIGGISKEKKNYQSKVYF